MRTLLAFSLLLLAACSQGSGSKSSSTATSANAAWRLLNTTPVFDTTIDSTTFTSTPNAAPVIYCLDATGKVTSDGEILPNSISGPNAVTYESMIFYPNGTYSNRIYDQNPIGCSITETGTLAFSPGTKSVTFSGVSNSTSCSFHRNLTAWAGSLLPINNDLSQSWTNGAQSGGTQSYIKFVGKPGYGLYVPQVSNAQNKCYIYYK